MLIKSNSALIVRCLSYNQLPKPLPVIKVPKYMEADVAKAVHDEDVRTRKVLNDNKVRVKTRGDRQRLVISGGLDVKYNHYYGQTYRNRSEPPLITKDWIKAKTNGQRMTFHSHGSNPADPNRSTTFKSLGLSPSVCDAIQSLGVDRPTDIQLRSIPAILSRQNVICCAETGSGKTVAYLAPILQLIREHKLLKGEQTYGKRRPAAIVIVPSRELAEQVGRVAQKMAAHCGVGVAVMIGGPPKKLTITGMDLVVTTIGLVQPLLQRGVYTLRNVNHIVIDEADTLFDDTFSFDVTDLLQSITIKYSETIEGSPEDSEEERVEMTGGAQLVCSSATMPRNLDRVIDSFVDLSSFARITTESVHCVMPHVRHHFYRIHKYDRDGKLLQLVDRDYSAGRPTMIFSNRTEMSNWVFHYLNQNNFPCLRLNKAIDDMERRDQFSRFQEGECDFISCSDLGSRGLDTTRVRHVINFDCPHYPSDYIHRAGRTGRVGSDSNCLVSSFVCFKPDVFMVQQLEKALRLNKDIAEVNGNIKQEMIRHKENHSSRKNKR